MPHDSSSLATVKCPTRVIAYKDPALDAVKTRPNSKSTVEESKRML